MKRMHGRGLIEAIIATVVIGVGAAVAITAMSAKQVNVSRDELVVTQAREMTQLLRAVRDFSSKQPQSVASVGEHVITIQQLASAGVLPSNFAVRGGTGLSGQVTPLGQQYVIKVVSAGGNPPRVQAAVSVAGAPQPELLKQAKIANTPQALSVFHQAVVNEMQTKLGQEAGFVVAGSTVTEAKSTGYEMQLVHHLTSDRSQPTAVAMMNFSTVQPLTVIEVGTQVSVSPTGCSVSQSGTCGAGMTSVASLDPCGAYKQTPTQYKDPRTGQVIAMPSPLAANAGVRMFGIYPDKLSESAGGQVKMSASEPEAFDGRGTCSSDVGITGINNGTNTGTQVGCALESFVQEYENGGGQAFRIARRWTCYQGTQYGLTAWSNLAQSTKDAYTAQVIAQNLWLTVETTIDPYTELEYNTPHWNPGVVATASPWDESNTTACAANTIAVNNGSNLFQMPPQNSAGVPLQYRRKGSVSLNGIVVATATCLTETRVVNASTPSASTWTSTLLAPTPAAYCCPGSSATNQAPDAPDPTDARNWLNERCDKPQYVCPPRGGSACYAHRAC